MSRKSTRSNKSREINRETPEEIPPARPITYWWLIVIAVAAAARLVFFLQFSRTPFANTLFLDSALYNDWAVSILKHHSMSDGRPFFIEPGYAYILAAIKHLGGSTVTVRILQSLIGVGTCLLTGVIAKRFGGDPAALATGVITGLYLPLIYFEGLVLKTTLEVFLSVLIVALFLKTIEKPTPLGALLVGVLMGLTCLVRSNILLLAVVFIPTYYLIARRGAAPRAWLAPVLVLAGLTPVLLAVGIRNKVAGGELLFVPYNSGINFYIGNSKTADGASPDLPFQDPDPKLEDAETQREAERRAGHPLTCSQVSSFWWKESLKEIGEDPGHWVQLMVNKFLLYCNHYEFTDNESIYFVGKYVPMLRWPLPGIWLALPLAFGGIFFALRKRKPDGLVLSTIIVLQMISVVAFHFADRYRLASVPFMLALGAPAVLSCIRTRREIVGVLSCAAAGLVLVALPNPVVPNGQPLYNHYGMLGSVAAASGNSDAALAAFQQAVTDNPRDTGSLVNLARALVNIKHDDAGAEANLRQAIAVDPKCGDALFQLGSILMRTQRLDEAADSFVKAANVGINPADSMISAGAAYGQSGHNDLALQWLQKGLALKPDDPIGLEMMGNAQYVAKNLDLAKMYWQKALQVKPDNPKLRQTYQLVFKTAP